MMKKAHNQIQLIIFDIDSIVLKSFAETDITDIFMVLFTMGFLAGIHGIRIIEVVWF